MNKIQKLIIKKMADGYTQPEVAAYLKKREITPNSLSMVEKASKIKKGIWCSYFSSSFCYVIQERGTEIKA